MSAAAENNGGNAMSDYNINKKETGQDIAAMRELHFGAEPTCSHLCALGGGILGADTRRSGRPDRRRGGRGRTVFRHGDPVGHFRHVPLTPR